MRKREAALRSKVMAASGEQPHNDEDATNLMKQFLQWEEAK